MTLDEEAQILKSVEQQSLLGNILIYKDIKVIVEEKLGKSLSDDYIWDMFKRHGWRKKMPRQSYPKADKAAQEEYKKPQELLASQNDQNIRDYDVNAWTTVYLPLNITFVSDISYKTGSGYAANYDVSQVVWNAGIEKSIMNNKGTIKEQ